MTPDHYALLEAMYLNLAALRGGYLQACCKVCDEPAIAKAYGFATWEALEKHFRAA
jgi:hypothetical protein